MKKEQVFDTIGAEIQQLPGLPTVVTRVMRMVNSPSSSAEDLASLVENDISMGTQILKLANSSFYGIPKTIASIRNAIVVLGFDTIRSLVLSANLAQVFPAKISDGFSALAFWSHGVHCAFVAKSLVSILNLDVDKEQAFTAGLLHDVGRLLLLQVFPKEYAKVIAEVQNGSAWATGEVRYFDTTSPRVSGKLLEMWNIPSSLRVPIANHETPGAQADVMTWLLHLSNHLAFGFGEPIVQGELAPQVDMGYEDVFGELDLQQIKKDLAIQMDEADAFVDLFRG